MTVSSASEFEAVMSRIRIGKRLDSLPNPTKLRDARRELDAIAEVARDGAQLKAKREELTAAAKVLRTEMPNDSEVSHMLWDLMDYVDYHC